MSPNNDIYKDIALRTNGDIYIGVVGPVRTGKSTFIKKFMENAVIPKIEDYSEKSRANDEMPQSANGRTVMTTEPKFVPENAVKIDLGNGLGFFVKLIDCVGFVVPGAQGTSDENGARMVNTPWSETPLPFEEAAAFGTRKVINEHSTVGIVVTTDGTIGEIPRENYLEAEENVINEMKETGKPFVVILNSQIPEDPDTKKLAEHLSFKYSVPVVPENCFALTESDITDILSELVLEFPAKEISVKLPGWLLSLPDEDETKTKIISAIDFAMKKAVKTGDIFPAVSLIAEEPLIESAAISSSDLGKGAVEAGVVLDGNLFYRVLGEKCGIPISGDEEIISLMTSLSETKEKYEKISKALSDCEEKGYGIVTPAIEDLVLEEPEIVKQQGGYGVRLKATAPSVHMIKAPITAEISPIVGSEKQTEDIVKFLLEEFRDDPARLWESNMFGKSLYDLVNEGLNSKLSNMPDDVRSKLAETLRRIVNEGSGGLICIIL